MPPPIEINTISADTLRTLVRRITQLEARVAQFTGPGVHSGASPLNPSGMDIATADGIITGKSGSTFGTGTVNLTVYDTGTEDLRETSVSFDVLNLFEASFADDEQLRIIRDKQGQLWAFPLCDDGKVKVDVDDVCAYLIDQYEKADTLNPGRESLRMTHEDLAADDPKVDTGISATEIENYSGTGIHVLIIRDGLWEFLEAEPCEL